MNKEKIVKNTRLRFTYEDDVALLKEFLSINPTVHPQGWETIQQHLLIITGKDFLIRTLKQHIMLLIEIWLKKAKVDQVRSGVEEPQSERDALLQEVHSLCQENNYTFKEKKLSLSKNQQICNLGKKIRENFAIKSFSSNVEESEMSMTDSYSECSILPLDPTNDHDYAFNVGPIEVEVIPTEIAMEDNSSVENLDTPAQSSSLPPPTPANINPKGGETSSSSSKENNKVLGPSRKRIHRKEPIRKNALAYLTDKHDKEAKIRIMELELEKRKVAVMERRLELDEKNIQLAEKRLDLEFKEKMIRVEIEKTKNELELEQKKITIQLLTSQQQLIDNLLKEKNINK